MQIGEKKEIYKAPEPICFLNMLFAYRHQQPEKILARNIKLTILSVFLLFSLKTSFLTHPQRQVGFCVISVLGRDKQCGS
jgi:hypothetical protein